MNYYTYESLLDYEIHPDICDFINENKLCKKEEYIKWITCYVYKVLI